MARHSPNPCLKTRGHATHPLLFADCFSVFSFAISPDRPVRADREDTRVGGSVVRLGLISLPPLIFDETISSVAVDHRQWCRMVLFETRVVFDERGLTLLLVIRGGLWLGECLDATAVGRNGPAETSPRFAARTEPS